MQPQEIDDVTMAFPAKVSHLMPAMVDIPTSYLGKQRWTEFQQAWFYGHRKIGAVVPKDGIDATKALRHLAAIQRSYEPKHEHKEAAVAYLASLWFEGFNYANEPAPSA